MKCSFRKKKPFKMVSKWKVLQLVPNGEYQLGPISFKWWLNVVFDKRTHFKWFPNGKPQLVPNGEYQMGSIGFKWWWNVVKKKTFQMVHKWEVSKLGAIGFKWWWNAVFEKKKTTFQMVSKGEVP